MPLPLLAADRRCELSTAEFHSSVTPFGNSAVHPLYQQVPVPAMVTTCNTRSWSWKGQQSYFIILKEESLPLSITGISISPSLLTIKYFRLESSPLLFSLGWVGFKAGLDTWRFSQSLFFSWLFYVSKGSFQTILRWSPSLIIPDSPTTSNCISYSQY